MSDQQPDEVKKPAPETSSSADANASQNLNASAEASETSKAVPDAASHPKTENAVSETEKVVPETEWIPGEQLELIRIPPPTIWPATLALGTTGIAFGVVTHWILSLAGLFLFLLGAKGWIEDMRKDVLQ